MIQKTWDDWKKPTKWTVREVYNLLCAMDQGYLPNKAETKVLETREELYLRSQEIKYIPRSIGRLRSLRTLNLWNNQISGIPASIGELRSLEVLDLSLNLITKLPETFGQLSALQTLDLCGTQITALPESFGQLSALQTLILSGTQIAALPETFGQLSALQYLDLRDTPITALPESFGQLSALQYLDLSRTPIAALPETFGQLAALQTLYLSNTRIAALPDSLSQHTNLKVLDLDGSKVKALPEWIGGLPALNHLDLTGLTLPAIPESLARRGLPFVEEKIFAYDQTGVNLFRTTLTEQDKSVFLQNDPALIAALYEKDNLLPLRESRVIFLGDGDSGKSYTIRRFRNGGRKETKANPYLTSETPGVEILDERVAYQGEQYTLHFWDFGGQQLLHAMHRCFLTDDTCYVVTVKSRETEATDRARYWLRNVTAFAPKSPILLYVNCWDNDNGQRVLEERILRDEFPQLIDVIYVSAKEAEDGDFREKLMEPLIQMAATSEGCKRSVNRRWVAVRRAIEAARKTSPYLDKGQYHTLCEDKGIENDNAPALLTYFNTIGVCFSYHRDEKKVELADYRLLNPVWLTNAIYAVIEEGMVYAEDGRIKDTAIRQMLCNKAPEQVRGKTYRRTAPEIVYRPDECPYILDVAILHNLCYRIDKTRLFFPALCPMNPPEEAVAKPGPGQKCLQYRLKYQYLPDNVVHRLMILCMQQNFAVKGCWLRGLILADTENRRVLVRMDDDETLRIDLWASPDHPIYSIFLWLREVLLKIDEDLGLTAKELIVDGEDQYSVISLLRASEKHSSVFGNVSGEERDAKDLLGDFYESRIIEGMRVEGNTIVIRILPYVYHPARKEDQALRKALFEAYNGVCAYCGNPLRNYREMEVDHIFPSKYQDLPELAEYVKYLKAHGFDTAKPDYVENYFPSHHPCNLDKSNHTEPFALLAWHHRAARMAPKVLRLMEQQQRPEKPLRKKRING